jgi:hypothetical protein
MINSDRLTPSSRRRRVGAAALVTLALMGAAATAATADPDTNIQKPGHVTYQQT